MQTATVIPVEFARRVLAPRRYQIVPSTFAHVVALGDRLRTQDAEEIAAFGVTPRRALWKNIRNGSHCRTAFVDGDIAAMWGLAGVLLSDVGIPWLLTTPAVERVPRAFVYEARRELAEMRRLKPKLMNWVPASYKEACRLIEILGFTLDPPKPFGPHNVPFRMFHIGF